MQLPELNQILKTERCILQIPQESDAEAIWNLITKNTTRYMIWDKGENTERTLKNIITTRKNAFDGISWDAAVYDKVSGKVIGRCGINATDKENMSFCIGYWIAEEYYGKGIIPECVNRLTQYMFEEGGFEKGIIRCDSKNENSAKVAVKGGFSLEGEFKKYEFIKGEFRDTKFFGITRDEYFSQKGSMKDPYQDEMTRIYNKHAEKYYAQVRDFEFPDGMYEKFLKELSGKKILDIGCGFGREISKLRDSGYEAYGIEISENMISFADTVIKQYITLGDFTKLEKYCSDKDFDGIISCASLVHMDVIIGQQVLQKVYELLKKDGTLFLSLKVSQVEKTIFKNSLSTPGVGKKYVYYKESDIENFLKDLGFNILHKHSWTPVEDTWNVYICKK